MGKVILLVEDNYIQGSHLQRALESEEYTILWFTEGESVLRKMQDRHDALEYHLAIIDRSLPDCDGSEIIAISKELYPTVPVICISAYGDKIKNVNSYITKPFSTNELIRIVKIYLPE